MAAPACFGEPSNAEMSLKLPPARAHKRVCSSPRCGWQSLSREPPHSPTVRMRAQYADTFIPLSHSIQLESGVPPRSASRVLLNEGRHRAADAFGVDVAAAKLCVAHAMRE